MNKVYFFSQMDSGTGTPEFFVDDPANCNRPDDLEHVMDLEMAEQILLEMKQQLGYFLASSNSVSDGEWDLDLVDQDLVLWELEDEDDDYETTTNERIYETLGEIEYSLEVLNDLKPAKEIHP